MACAQSVVFLCPPMAPAHLSSGTDHSGCSSAAGCGVSAGSRAAAGTTGSAGHGGKPWEAQRESGMAPCEARARGTWVTHVSTQCPSAVTQCCGPCTPICPAVPACPAHRQARLVAQRWAHCSAVPCSGSGGGESTGTASSSVARRRWKSLRGDRWPGECGKSSVWPWGHSMSTGALWSVGSLLHGGGYPCPIEPGISLFHRAWDPCPMEEGNTVLWSMGTM